jgi:multiple sugar transport system permease protein
MPGFDAAGARLVESETVLAGEALIPARTESAAAKRRPLRRSPVADWVSRHLESLLATPALLLLALFTAWPLLVSLVMSLTGPKAAGGIGRGFAGLQNFSSVAVDPTARQALLVTTLLVLSVVTIEFLLGLVVALALRRSFRGRSIVISILVLPLFISPVAVGQSGAILLDPLYAPARDLFIRVAGEQAAAAMNTEIVWRFLEIALADTWRWTPFMVIVLLAALASVPKRIHEMAELDGISRWRKLWSLTLPYVAPLVLLALAIRVLDAIRLFDIVTVTSRSDAAANTSTASVYLYTIGFEQLQHSLAAAGSLILILPVGVLIFLSARLLLRIEAA